jgi:hypothetical protein
MILEPYMSRNAKVVWTGAALLLLAAGIVVLLVK